MSLNTGKVFTLDFLQWKPWIERADETALSEEERSRLVDAIGTGPNSDYAAVLANDYGAWQARALVHRHVYVDDTPDTAARRELAATTASRINGCVFCASVHARMYAAASKRRDLAVRFLADGLDADLPAIERAVVDLAAKITLDPESLTGADLEPLRALGVDEDGLVDVINYASFFANANRLMLTLGAPAEEALDQG